MNFKNKQIFVYTLFITLLLLSYSNAASFRLFQGLSASLSFPQSVLSINANETVSAMVSGGTPPYTYEWSLNGKSVGRNSNLFLLNGNESTLGYDNVTLTVTDQYNDFASVTNFIYVENPNFFTSYISPNYETADFGQNITFKVSTASGTAPYTYHWNFISEKGVQSTFNCVTSICNITATENGSVQATVIDAYGRVSSTISKVIIVGSPISVTILPYTSNINPAYQQILSAAVSGGSGNFTYQWYNYTPGIGVPIAGATSNTLILNSFYTTGTFDYYVIVYDSKTSSINLAKSNLAYINVKNPGTITQQVPTSSSYTTLVNPVCNIINMTQGYSTANAVYGNTFLLSETLLTNNGAYISVDSHAYYMGINQTQYLGSVGNYSYSLKLFKIYGDVILSSAVKLCGSEIKTIQVNKPPSISVQNNTGTLENIPATYILLDNSSKTTLNQTVGNVNIIYAYSNYPQDDVALIANNETLSTGIGNLTYNTKFMNPGNYLLKACDTTAVPEICSENITINISSEKVSQGFSLSNLSLPIPPLYVGLIVLVVVIAIIYTVYKRRSDDYDYLYGSKSQTDSYSSKPDDKPDNNVYNSKLNAKTSNTTKSTKQTMQESTDTDDAPITISKASDYYKSQKDTQNTSDKMDWSSESKE